jgi:hypothetical protein
MYSKSITPEKIRIIVETDAPGGDPDDEASLVRFFLYMNEWDVEALIGTRKSSQSRLKISGKKRILQYIDDYEKVYHNLIIHKNYPDPAYLRQRTQHTNIKGKDLITSIIDKDDHRPIWYLNWGTNDGNTTALRQSFDKVKAERSSAEYQKFISKIRYVGSHNQDHLGEHWNNLEFGMDTFYPEMDGGRWYHRWQVLTTFAGGFDIDRDVKNNHGSLCANYTIVKEGDTMTFMHLIPNGLHDIYHPEWGCWSGRYNLNKELNIRWCDQQDTWDDTTNRDNTLKRWADHIQNDFRARADWCVSSRFENANHEPMPCLQGDLSQKVIHIDVPVGLDFSLSAKGSTDPDGDNLSFQWFYYPEAGTYHGNVKIVGQTSENCVIHIPSDALGKTIHIILQVTDDGEPPLTRYRRVVLTGVSKIP